ncbi:RNA polymerase ECF-type sigma factor [Pedobacter sp. BAL39]|uniref:RNA polymerase sigma factor n=1 Tax=Pedobacter sp. BAL39 TaxID=391596 RepID=UPI0001559742|nr:RNA polymerase sigma-70 factor [Pedobacter sp. BAL39]EDM36205.1 RNA polymerase ECF-type sigma factor [Pedobacter sp. BAL39]
MLEYSTLSDAELTVLLKLGDRTAYTEIYHRYKFVLHNHAWNKTRNREEAQDAIQEVFAMLWAKREQLSLETNLAGYLYTSVRNHILNQIVRKEVQTKYINSIHQFAEEEPVVTDYRARENQLKQLIEKEIAALPPRMRLVFELSRKSHLTHKEIAEQLGTSEQTIKKQMTNTLRVLRVKLGLFVYVFFLFYR